MDKKCRICGDILNVFLPFGKVPISNTYLTKEQLDGLNIGEFKEYMYDLEAAFCNNCKMVQLTEFVPYEKYITPQEDGSTEYLFYSSTSQFMQKHFAEFAQEIATKFMKMNDLVVEIGSNDGIMLQAFDQAKVRVLGIEPGTNVANVARAKGIENVTEFFTEDLARKIVNTKGKAKAILSANVILNIGDLHELMRGINILMDDNGVFVFQDPYMPYILEKNSFDQFYDEHVYYFCITSLQNLMKMHGMEIFDVQEQDVHGGSMRVYVKRQSDSRPISEKVRKILEQEDKIGLNSFSTYQAFAERVERIKKNLRDFLRLLKENGYKLAGYAATCKSSTALNYCGIGTEFLDYISDSTPEKQRKFSPGKHIPIVSPEHFRQDNPPYTLLLAWNHEKEILGKEKDYLKRGGKFIIYNPCLRIV